MATLDQLMITVIRAHFSPPPPRRTVKGWLDSANIPRFKPNTKCTRGGGVVFYNVASVEQFIIEHTTCKS